MVLRQSGGLVRIGLDFSGLCFYHLDMDHQEFGGVAERVVVTFHRAESGKASREEQRRSLCASGYVYSGKLQLLGEGARVVLELPVQTGGWMSADSPFARAGLYPADATWGNYEPTDYPDTAFPALPEPTELGTLRTGMHRGFRVPDPPGTGRSYLMVHASTRYGSEGCISTPDADGWERFCACMAELHERGVQAIPLQVSYTCAAPDPLRCPRR